MKKYLILALLILCATVIKAQESFLFKIKYLPNHLYQSIIETKSNMEMNITGDSAVMENIKEKNLKMPMIVATETDIDLGIKTGSVTSGSFPIKIKYNSIKKKKTTNGKETDTPENPMVGQSIYGQYTLDGKLMIDSISGKTLDDNIKASIESGISNLLSQIHFPDHPMKIGETFEQDIPFSMPISGINMQLTIKIIYTLTSVEKGIALFKLDESLDMNVSSENDNTKMVMKGTGSGSGNMTYDIANSFSSSRKTGLTMTYQLTAGTMNMNGKAEIYSTTQNQLLALTNK